MTSAKVEFLPYLDEMYGAEDPTYEQIETELTLSKIYYSTKPWLSWHERAIFCYLMSDYTLLEISQILKLDLHLIARFERTLIGKLYYAATATQAELDIYGTCNSSENQTGASCNLH